jgi:hypothetical protein
LKLAQVLATDEGNRGPQGQRGCSLDNSTRPQDKSKPKQTHAAQHRWQLDHGQAEVEDMKRWMGRSIFRHAYRDYDSGSKILFSEPNSKFL